MVKNAIGGNKGKKIARKHIVSNSFNSKLRTSEDEDEVYACVSKLLGNGMCHVNCLDVVKNTSKQRLCIIRNKFRGRGKRDNTLCVGTYVLVGLRSWESSKEGILEKCDLIEVYSKGETTRLKSQVDKNWSAIHIGDLSELKSDDNDLFEFGTVEENTELKEEVKNLANKGGDNENESFIINDNLINIDDI